MTLWHTRQRKSETDREKIHIDDQSNGIEPGRRAFRRRAASAVPGR
jgi:hypothetical protein